MENRFIRVSNISATATHAQLIFQSLKSYEYLHFSDPVVDISDRHVKNVIFLGKTNTAIHDPHINGMGSSIAIIIITITGFPPGMFERGGEGSGGPPQKNFF